MSDNETIAVLVGLVCGIAFIVPVMVMVDSFGTRFPTSPSHFLRIASKLPETQAFLSNYPNSNSTVFARDIVEYWSQEEDRYAGLRIQIDRSNGEPTFMELRCIVIGNELDYTKIQGSRLEGITAFLQDERCPK
jgi:hypothetical protein